MSDKTDAIEVFKKEYLQFKHADPGVISGISNFAMKPIEIAASKIMPAEVTDKVTDALAMAIEKLMFASDKLYSDSAIIKEVSKHGPGIATLNDLRTLDDVDAMNSAAHSFIASNVSFAATQGAATGALGLVGLPANIPALFTVIFRMLQQITVSYGFDPRRPEEKDFHLKILAVATTSRKVDKEQALSDIEASSDYLKSQFSKIGLQVALKQTQITLMRKTWKSMGDKSALIVIRNLLKNVGVNLTKKKALQSIPLVSGVIGAAFDATYTKDVGKVANMLYRNRRLDFDTNRVLEIQYTEIEDQEVNNDLQSEDNPFADTSAPEDNPFTQAETPLSPEMKKVIAFLSKVGLADGLLDDSEEKTIRQSVADAGEMITDEEFAEIKKMAESESIEQLCHDLDDADTEAKEMTLVLAILTSMADGTVHKEEANMIQTAARNFGFDKAAFDGIYAQAAELKKQIA
ncbi:EcsC family protein [Verrucomicrobiales bacterium]|nr:EcsC family protein [Verrucomicrobiales bacterium]